MRSDQENAIEELVREVKKKTAVEIVHKESPVGESQSNGMVERAVEEVQKQTRIMKSGLEEILGMKLKRDHLISTWLVMHAANTSNRFRVGLDGRMAYQRVTGKGFERPVVEFGEVVWALRPKSRGISKWDYRWYEGVWVGVVNKSGEHIVLTEEGATRTPHVRGRPEGEYRWNIGALNRARGLPWEPVPGKNSVQIPVRIDIPDGEGEPKEDEFGNRVVERRRPMTRREDVEKLGPTPGCPACHNQMLNKPLVGVSHTEECMNKHGNRMARDKDPRSERAFENLMQEDEEVMRRKNVYRQATEDRELHNKRRAEDLRGGTREEQPGSASSTPYVPGEGAARRETSADRPEVGTGQGGQERARELDEDEPRVAKTVRRGELEQGDEPVAMEDDNEEGDIADAICRVAGGAFPKDGRRRRWDEEVRKVEEAISIDKEAGILNPIMSQTTPCENAQHRILEATPGMMIYLTGSKEQEGGWDLSKDDHYCEAKRKVTNREGILLIDSARHIAKGEKLVKDDLAKDEIDGGRWRELARIQEQNGMYHAMVVPTKSRMSGTQRFKRLIEGT